MIRMEFLTSAPDEIGAQQGALLTDRLFRREHTWIPGKNRGNTESGAIRKRCSVEGATARK